MRQEEKDKLKKYGKLVCDIVNAKTTDEILISYFNNIRSIFNFSNNYTKNILTKFPTKQMILGKFSSNEYALLEMLMKRDDILEFYSDKYVTLAQYDPQNLNFTAIEYLDEKEKKHLIPIQKIEKYKELFPETKNFQKDMNTLVEICNKIEKNKLDTTIHYDYIEKLSKNYSNILRLHNYITKIQRQLRQILLKIIKADNAYQLEEFKDILLLYNEMPKNIYAVDKDKLIEISPFNENEFYIRPKSSLHNIFNIPISYCLVEYLKHPEYKGKERLSVCQKCNCIFTKSKFYDYQIFCPPCSRKSRMTPEQRAAYMREYRANPIVKKRERKR